MLSLGLHDGSAAAGAPRGAHVSFGADPTTSATIVWFTDGSADPGTVVEYGPEAQTLTSAKTGTSRPAPGTGYPSGSVLVHEVALEGLAPGSTIHYRAGSPEGWTPVRSFRTAPSEGDAFRFVAYADQDVTPAAAATTQAVLAADPAFVVIAGDLSYAQPGTPTFPEWPKWDAWFDMIEPLASTRAVMPAVGNHECESVGCTASFRARFALPGRELFYSFDHRNAHFLVFLSDRNTWTQERVLADALAFAETDLSAAAERKAAGEIDWIFVVQHHPLYGNQRGDLVVDELLERKRNPALIALEEPMLLRHDVDVLITGHNHNYERSAPMALGVPTSSERSEYTDPAGYIQIVTGGAGRGAATLDQPGPLSLWTLSQSQRNHYTQFEVDGKTLTFTAVATDGGVRPLLDSFTLRRS